MRGSRRFFLMLGIFMSLLFTCFSGKSQAWGKDSLIVAYDLFAAAVIAENTYLMAGDRGTILWSGDRGNTWKTIESPTKRALAGVCFADEQHGWIVGQAGVILHSSDKGQTWQSQTSGVDKYLLDVSFSDKNYGCAVGADSTVVVTSDGGQTWKISPFKVPEDLGEEYNLFIVVMIDAQRIFIAGDGGRIFKTEDAGESWPEVQSPLYDPEIMEGRIIYSMVQNSGTLYAVGIDGLWIYSRDWGNTWQERDTGFSGPELYCLDMVDGTGLAAGLGGHIIETSDHGKTWRLVEVPEKMTRVWFSGLDLKKTRSGNIYGLVAGQNGTFGLFADGKWMWK